MTYYTIMELSYYVKMAAVEEEHWWFAGRRQAVLVLLEDHLKPDLDILDAGCGAGATIKMLSKYGLVQGIDISDKMVEHCRRQGLAVKQESITSLPFPDNSFDLTLALDVIEHLPDEQPALQELYRVTRPGGITLISVPAFNCLWGNHDRINNHYRRYDPGILKKVVQENNYILKRCTYFNFLLFPAVLAVRLCFRQKKFSGDDLNWGRGRLNGLLKQVLLLEARSLRRFNLPLGVSEMLVAQVPRDKKISCGQGRDLVQ